TIFLVIRLSGGHRASRGRDEPVTSGQCGPPADAGRGPVEAQYPMVAPTSMKPDPPPGTGLRISQYCPGGYSGLLCGRRTGVAHSQTGPGTAYGPVPTR